MQKSKIILFIVFIKTVLISIGCIFWHQEYQYALPTPKPNELIQLNAGDSIDKTSLPFEIAGNTFIHFYNYDCPCSRFNIKEFQSLVHRFSDRIKFIAVISTPSDDESEIEAFRKKYDLGITTIIDHDGIIAGSLGVYSTPQAVLLTKNQLFYKGNYNKARFCLTKNTKFAEMAVKALINNEKLPIFPEVATLAYGCELPNHESKQKSLFNLF